MIPKLSNFLKQKNKRNAVNQAFLSLLPNAADRNRTFTIIRKPHRKEDCATSANSCTRFVQLYYFKCSTPNQSSFSIDSIIPSAVQSRILSSCLPFSINSNAAGTDRATVPNRAAGRLSERPLPTTPR